MALGDAKDVRDLTRAIKGLANTQEKLVKVCEAINTNLLAVAKQQSQKMVCKNSACDYLEPHNHGEHACDPDCVKCEVLSSGI